MTMARIEQGVLDKDVLRSMSVELSGGCRAQRTAGDVPHIVRPVAGLDSGWKEHEPIENNGGDIVIYSSPRKSGGAPCASSTSASKPQLAIMSTQPIAVDIMATQPFTVDIQPVLTNARPAAITDAPCALAASNASGKIYLWRPSTD